MRHLRVYCGDIERAAFAWMGFHGRGLRAFSTTSFHCTTLTRPVQSYILTLTILILCKPVIQARSLSLHASLVTLSIFAVYGVRVLEPLATFRDRSSLDWTVWTKFGLSGFAGVLLPLFEPYAYVPLDPTASLPLMFPSRSSDQSPQKPQETVNPEQTASLISFFSFSFLSPVIYKAWGVTHLETSMLPPQLETDRMAAIGPRAFPYFDPLATPHRRVNIYWALIAAFARSWALQAVLVTLSAVTTLGSPIGTNQLLAYIENAGAGAVFRPWVWILLVALSPLVQNLADQLYMYNNARTATQIEATITAVVYRHALRIRVVNKTDDATPSVAPMASTMPKANPAGTTEAPTSPDSQAVEVATTHSRAETSTTVVGSDDGSSKKDDASVGGEEEKKTTDVVGRLNNLVTSDLESITAGRDWLLYGMNSVIQLVLGSWFLYSILGWSAFVGLGVMVVLAPVPALVSTLMNATQTAKMKATDTRVEYIKEILAILRMVKQFGWETRVKDEIDAKRAAELRLTFRREMLQLVNMVVNYTIPLCHLIVTFVVYTVVMKQRLTASVVFAAITGFNMLRMSIFMLVFFIPQFIQANVAIKRVQEFLNDTELLDSFSEEATIQDASALHAEDLGFAQASFFWSKEHTSGALTPSRQKFRLRIEDDVVFKKGALNLIIGPTGCGKSSMLQALLGEMHYVPSGPGAWTNIPRIGGIAYCAQEAWIQSLSIKENILFGQPYNEARYKKVIYQCGLKRDLTLFDAGDLTEIGEKGLTLSGGQKARISLARAVYSSAQILLLDDILAALDVHTAVFIVNKCLKGDLVKGRTVLLVTHNVALTTPIADFVVSLGTDGRIISQGAPTTVVVEDKALAEQIAHEQEAIELEEELEEQTEEAKAAAKGSKVSQCRSFRLMTRTLTDELSSLSPRRSTKAAFLGRRRSSCSLISALSPYFSVSVTWRGVWWTRPARSSRCVSPVPPHFSVSASNVV
jgi:ABC-type multidrug transport system fused ATPase/permease subunit